MANAERNPVLIQSEPIRDLGSKWSGASSCGTRTGTGAPELRDRCEMNESTRAKRQSQRVTADEVARVLGVSQSTISRAFTATASISDEMRTRVMATAAELGHHPKVTARSLMTRRTNIIAIVLPNLTDPFYAVVLDELTQRLQPRG